MPNQLILAHGLIYCGLGSAMFNFILNFTFRKIKKCIGSISLIKNRLMMREFLFCKIEKNPYHIWSKENIEHFIVKLLISIFE